MPQNNISCQKARRSGGRGRRPRREQLQRPVQLTTRTTRAGETRKLFWDKERGQREDGGTTAFTSAGAAPPRPARARAAARSRAPSGAGAPPAPAPALLKARRRSRAPAPAPGAARESASSFRVWEARRRAPRAPPQVTRGTPRRASRGGTWTWARASLRVTRVICRGGRGRGTTDASAGGSSAQQRSSEAAAAAARPGGSGPGLLALCGVRAAAGRARKAASPDCASGATSAGVTLGGSCAAVRARFGGGSAIGQGTRTRNGVGYHASGAARWSRRAGAAHCSSRGVSSAAAMAMVCVCVRQGVRLPLKWGPRCCLGGLQAGVLRGWRTPRGGEHVPRRLSRVPPSVSVR